MLSWSSLKPLISVDLVSVMHLNFRARIHCYYCLYITSTQTCIDIDNLFYLDSTLRYGNAASYRRDKQIDKSYLNVYQNI